MPEADILLYILCLDREPKTPHTTLLVLVNELEMKVHGGRDMIPRVIRSDCLQVSSSLAFVSAKGSAHP